MNEKTIMDANCDCEGDCCQPKKKPSLKKYLSILVFLIALSIIVIKVVSKDTEVKSAPTAAVAGTSSCCDPSVAKDSTGKSCCPQK